MNLSISHDSEVEAFAFPFLFLEVSLAFGAINGYGKTKSFSFYHTKLRRLLVLEQKKKEESRRRRNRGDGGGFVLRPRRIGSVMLCENERVKMDLYRSGEGGMVWLLWVGLGRKVV